jgi:GT2 family glycosyltransferase
MILGYVCTNFNNSAFTRGAVASLEPTLRAGGARVVVVDNASRPNDAAALGALAAEFPHVEVILNRANLGYFGGLNVGIEHLRRVAPEVEILAIGNNDLEFPADFPRTVARHRDVFDRWAVVAPDLVTFDGVHQNPHVLRPISALRKRIWDLYYASYPAATVIKHAARLTKRFTVREENSPSSLLYRAAGPIEQGYGACYLVGPAFFRHFTRLAAPTFMMQEEFFLGEQLKTIGQQTYYDPRFVVRHHGHATMDALPSRRHWALSHDAHVVYKRYEGLSPADQTQFITAASQGAP